VLDIRYGPFGVVSHPPWGILSHSWIERKIFTLSPILHTTLLRGPVEPRQYVSLGFGQAARDAGIAISMGSRGDAYDNAVAESFFATLKKELIHRQSWPTRRELSSAVFEYIEAFYNRDRRHSTLGMHSPAEYETLLYAANEPGNRSTETIKSKSVV